MGDGTGCDNMTAVIVQFKKEAGSGEAEEAAKVNGEASSAEKKQVGDIII